MIDAVVKSYMLDFGLSLADAQSLAEQEIAHKRTVALELKRRQPKSAKPRTEKKKGDIFISKKKRFECADHLGNAFKTMQEMCKYYKVSYHTFLYRKNVKHLSLEECLASNAESNLVKDHAGHLFSNTQAMCDYYRINVHTFLGRRQLGWSLADALTRPNNLKQASVQCKDHFGKVYSSYREMCEAYNITPCVFTNRRKQGWSLEQCLTTPKADYSCEDHLGNVFKNQEKRARYYGLSKEVVRQRLARGLTLKQALTSPKAGSK